jgi:hypothetical protein
MFYQPCVLCKKRRRRCDRNTPSCDECKRQVNKFHAASARSPHWQCLIPIWLSRLSKVCEYSNRRDAVVETHLTPLIQTVRRRNSWDKHGIITDSLSGFKTWHFINTGTSIEKLVNQQRVRSHVMKHYQRQRRQNSMTAIQYKDPKINESRSMVYWRKDPFVKFPVELTASLEELINHSKSYRWRDTTIFLE